MRVDEHARPRASVLLALGQIRYQLLLLVRNPMGFFIALVIPLLLLVCLNLLTPDAATAMPAGLHYAQFLAPAVAAFSLLNTCYVNTVTGVVLAREEGVLKRLRGTPLPTWCYLAGRLGSTFVTSAVAVAVIVTLAVTAFHVTVTARTIGYLAGVGCLGAVSFFLLGLAVVAVVPKSETALPVAYGTMLPLAFISDVFFSSAHAPQWLHDVASALPVAPVTRAMEAAFLPTAQSWPMPTSAMLTVGAWSLAAIVIIALTFRWEPGPIHSGHR
ncbi:ABC transporter permease [Amycolatopsis mongoliensis]|uniref:Transport permease protein n=1 Tax=Amycolatopsis mongoliensis TaxID=715475 RepID=A0A9Y2NBC4_9PSEU|nr:ABC transporter permease [Amycolatopsis sp. 4-36]WIX98336.1 ABC transporter permease [Amycolatopsis sp. 4-36]